MKDRGSVLGGGRERVRTASAQMGHFVGHLDRDVGVLSYGSSGDCDFQAVDVKIEWLV